MRFALLALVCFLLICSFWLYVNYGRLIFYDDRYLADKKRNLEQLREKAMSDPLLLSGQGKKQESRQDYYLSQFGLQFGNNNSPEDLAMLALWGLSRSKVWHRDLVDENIYVGSIHMLGVLKTLRAKRALEYLKVRVMLNGDFDGFPAEELIEAEHLQKDGK